MSTRETRSSSSKSAGKKKSPNPSSDAETITLESINPTFLTDILRTFPATIEKLVSRIEDLTSHVGELEEKLNRLQTTVNPSTTPDVCPTCKGTATASTNLPNSMGHILVGCEKISTKGFNGGIDSYWCLESPKNLLNLKSLGTTQGGHALFK